MSRVKISKLWLLTKNECEQLIAESDSFVEILRKLDLCTTGGNYLTLKKIFTNYQLDYSKFQHDNTGKKFNIPSKVSNEELFTENNIHGRCTLKKRIIKEKLIPYKCACCGIDPIWNGKELVLVLDHINGINNDNRLENLRFLCPNCNAQQDTFCGKHKKKKTTNEEREKLQILNQERLQEKINRIKNYDIDFYKFGWVEQVAKLEKTSHTQVRRWMKKYMPEFYSKCYVRKNQFE